MPPILVYLLRLSISLGVVWLFYQLLLRRLTFYGLKRWYLFGYSVLSFFIPLIDIGDLLGADGPGGESSVIRYIPVVGGGGPVHRVVAGRGVGTDGWSMWMVAVAAGGAVLLVRTAVRWLSLLRLRQKARRVEGTGWTIYQVD